VIDRALISLDGRRSIQPRWVRPITTTGILATDRGIATVRLPHPALPMVIPGFAMDRLPGSIDRHL
jgi:hypothetical protein